MDSEKLNYEKTLMVLIATVFMMLLLPIGAFCIPLVEWNKTYPDPYSNGTILSAGIGYSVQETNDGGYIVAGQNCSGRSKERNGCAIWIARTDPSGKKLWERNYLGKQGQDEARAIIETSDGGYAIVGTTYYEVGYVRIIVLKIDSNGKVEWNRAEWNGDGYDIQNTIDGGYIIAGDHVTNSGKFDLILIKTDSSGMEQWEKIYDGPSGTQGSGFQVQGPTFLGRLSLQVTTDGGYIVAGMAGKQAWLLKVDSSGEMQWQEIYREGYFGGFNYVQQTNDGGYVGTGMTDSDNGESVLLVKTDSQGREQWNRIFGHGRGYSVQNTNDGGYLILSDIEGVTLIKTDSMGNEQWNKTYSKGMLVSSQYYQPWYIQNTSDGGYIITGRNGGLAFLLKLSDSTKQEVSNLIAKQEISNLNVTPDKSEKKLGDIPSSAFNQS